MTDDKTRKLYELEKSLADRIKSAPRGDRARVTMEAYNELFRAAPWHPELNHSEEWVEREIRARARMLSRLIHKTDTILEFGCGQGDLTKRLAEMGAKAVGVDISKEVLPQPSSPVPEGATFQIGDACDVPFEDGTFDVALSWHLIEHLHPEDVETHLETVRRILKPGGRYIVVTPNRLTGPHDVSKHFDKIATCFHLKEWSYRDLAKQLGSAGFTNLRVQMLPNAIAARSELAFRAGFRSVRWKIALESVVGMIPRGSVRSKVANLLRVGAVFVVATRG